MRKVFIYTIAVIFVSCGGNGIKFNIKDSTITQENGKGLYRLIISSDSLDDFYYIELKEGKSPQHQISLIDVDSNYSIADWHNMQIEEIKLQPNRIYTIENRSDGDCSPGVVTFMTNSLGEPAKSYE